LSEKVEFQGFGSVGFLGSTKNNYLTESRGGSFDFVEAAINVGVDLRDDLRVGAQIFVGNLGEYGNYEPRLDWGYIDWRPKNWLGMRGGRFKRAHGFYNETLDVDAARTFILLPQGVYNLAYRDFFLAVTGAGSYGNVSLGAAGDLDYQAYMGASSIPKDGSVARKMEDGGSMRLTDANYDFSPGFALVWHTPLAGLRTGISVTTFVADMQVDVVPFLQTLGLPPTTTLGLDAKTWVYSAEYSVGSWVFTGEYSGTSGPVTNPFLAQTLAYEHYYGQGTYRINDMFEVGSYYSASYDDKNDKKGVSYTPFHSAFQKDFAACLRFDPTRRLILKLEYHNVDGTLSVLGLDNPEGKQQKWQYLATKVTFAF
jgi:hypothetical protein